MAYSWTYTLTPEHLTERDPEWWARRTFDLPRPVRAGLVFGWRYPLRLRLGPGGILGWALTHEPGAAVMTADGPLCRATNTVRVAGETVSWTTEVQSKNRLGAIMWAAAAQVHQRTLPFMLRRAAR